MPWSKSSTEALARIQSADGWSRVSRGARKAPFGHGVKGSRNASLPRRRRLGSRGQARPMVDGVWGERSLPDGADPPLPTLPSADSDGIGKRHRERVATGERSVSLAKICVKATGEAVVPHTSCGLRYGNSCPYSDGYAQVVPIAPICGLCGPGTFVAVFAKDANT